MTCLVLFIGIMVMAVHEHCCINKLINSITHLISLFGHFRHILPTTQFCTLFCIVDLININATVYYSL